MTIFLDYVLAIFCMLNYAIVIKTYILLSKPGIVIGNVVAMVGAYSLGANGNLAQKSFFGVLLGTGLIIASAGYINNTIDKNIDKKMERTKKRAVASGVVSPKRALLLGSLLGLLGFLSLITFTNCKTVWVGVAGYLGYLFIYGWAKRKSAHGTLVGAFPGATPPLAGYLAATNHLDAAAWLLFLIMLFWQMPHFYAIAVRRLKDYRAAGIPVLPAVKGLQSTIWQMIGYTGLFMVASLQLYRIGAVSAIFVIVIIPLSLYWIWHTWQGSKQADKVAWAKTSLGLSLKVLFVFSVLWLLNPLFTKVL